MAFPRYISILVTDKIHYIHLAFSVGKQNDDNGFYQ